MTYNSFVIYFLIFPTFSLLPGSLVYQPRESIKSFFLIVLCSSLFLLFSFFTLENILLILRLKSTNLYFAPSRKLGHLCWIRVAYYMLVPWLISCICLLFNRIPKKSKNLKLIKVKAQRLKIFFRSLNLLLFLDFLFLGLSLTYTSFYHLRVLTICILWLLLLFNVLVYLRLKRNCYNLYLVNWASLVIALYTLLFSSFVNEPLYYYEWPWPSPFFEETLLILGSYLIGSESLLLFSHIWNKKTQKTESSFERDTDQKTHLYPFCSYRYTEIDEEFIKQT